MANKILSTITELPVAEIDFGDRLRPVSPAGVESLKASISAMGMIKDPIHVRKIKRSGQFVLMAGGHRLTAAIELGWETIKVTCWECSNDFAELMEIDDNLAGSELSILDRAVFMATRKTVYERLYPEAKHGGDRKSDAYRNQNDTMSFCLSAAEKLGCSTKKVERLVRGGAALSRQDIINLRNAPNPVTLKDLTEIAKIGEVSERDRVVALLSKGDVKNASEARRKYQSELGNGPAPLNNTDATFARLLDAWRRAPKAARKMFLEEEGDDVRAVLAELKGGSE